MPSRLMAGELEAGVIQVSPSSPAPFAKDAMAIQGAQLVPISGPAMSRLRERYPFFRPVTIPGGTYGAHGDTETVGMDFILVCREPVRDDVVYEMMKVLFESLPELAGHHPGLALIAFQQRSGVPIPLHPGAARFYRERELFR
jgi:TRAP transporter TAXI family solute receptor